MARAPGGACSTLSKLGPVGRNLFRDLSKPFLNDLSGDRQLQVYRRLARREAFPHSRLDGLYRCLGLRQ